MTKPIDIPVKKVSSGPTSSNPGRPVPKPRVQPTIVTAKSPVNLTKIVEKERLAEQEILADRFKQLDFEDEFAKTGIPFPLVFEGEEEKPTTSK